MEQPLPAGNQELPAPTPLDQPATMNIAAAARVLGIGRQTAYELARQGKLPVLRLGRRLVVPKAALERMLSEAGSARVEMKSNE